MASKKTPRAAKGNRKTALPEPVLVVPVVRSTKKEIVIGLLSRHDGATLEELMNATGWQAHSVRGFISGTLRKKHGLSVTRTNQTYAVSAT